jgi:hypothetical protein
MEQKVPKSTYHNGDKYHKRSDFKKLLPVLSTLLLLEFTVVWFELRVDNRIAKDKDEHDYCDCEPFNHSLLHAAYLRHHNKVVVSVAFDTVDLLLLENLHCLAIAVHFVLSLALARLDEPCVKFEQLQVGEAVESVFFELFQEWSQRSFRQSKKLFVSCIDRSFLLTNRA